MSPNRLSLYSEPYSPSGNLAADGFRKLLGTPSLDLLQTVVRESVQNSCDAAKMGKGPEVRFRLRRLDGEMLNALRENIFYELPQQDESYRALNNFLIADMPWVLEICDFGTTGLAGATQADIAIADGEPTDFVDFMRNVGSPRDTHQGGGTYGYGKTSLYLSSRCTTVLVDSQTTHKCQPVRRVMGCHLGSAFQSERDGGRRRFTGRHWWGVRGVAGDFVDPAEGEVGDALSNAVGFAKRGAEDTGTSIMVMDPVFMSEDPSLVIGRLQEALLWHFWPRLLSTTEESKRLAVTIELDGQAIPLPPPEEFAPLNLFAESINELRKSETGGRSIRCERPRQELGRLEVTKGLHVHRTWLVPPEESLIPERCSHIAVMRPVELVVRYFEGDPLPDPQVEWAGVFIASKVPEVEKAFAKAEPPAHDDWQPSLLPRGSARTFVNVAIQRLREAAKSVAGPIGQDIPSGDDGGPSLARAAEALGNALNSLAITSNGAAGRRPRKTNRRRKATVGTPKFNRLEISQYGPAAVFVSSINYAPRNGGEGRLRAKLGIVIDGAPIPEKGDRSLPTPPVLEWRSLEGEILGTGDEILIGRFQGILEIVVGLSSDYAVGLAVELLTSEAN